MAQGRPMLLSVVVSMAEPPEQIQLCSCRAYLTMQAKIWSNTPEPPDPPDPPDVYDPLSPSCNIFYPWPPLPCTTTSLTKLRVVPAFERSFTVSIISSPELTGNLPRVSGSSRKSHTLLPSQTTSSRRPQILRWIKFTLLMGQIKLFSPLRPKGKACGNHPFKLSVHSICFVLCREWFSTKILLYGEIKTNIVLFFEEIILTNFLLYGEIVFIIFLRSGENQSTDILFY
ncbi:hypothetical protein AALP_AA5G100400 [Arabis alpina]|uniref:Uncharacterized protein n=1 Tax=Arabis alpina TaxID=50452 RepID=A0A087GW33_ARAAL|nr:hypothetical protein AALP_AA5G100400 [Arabis alpina]